MDPTQTKVNSAKGFGIQPFYWNIVSGRFRKRPQVRLGLNLIFPFFPYADT